MSKKRRKEKPRPIVSGLFLILLGVGLLLSANDVVHPEDMWPLLIIFFGGVIVARAFRRRGQSTAPPPPETHQQTTSHS